LPLDFLLEFEREAKARKAHGKTAPGRRNTCGMHARDKRQSQHRHRRQDRRIPATCAGRLNTGDTGPVMSCTFRTREAYVIAWKDGMAAQETTDGDIDEARAAAERLAEARG
jgi:hypothetical protein